MALLYLIAISMMCVLFVVLGAKFISKIQGNSQIYVCYYGIAPAILFVAMLSVFRGYFQGQLNMIPTALSCLIEQIGRLFLGLYFAGKFIKNGTVFGYWGRTA